MDARLSHQTCIPCPFVDVYRTTLETYAFELVSLVRTELLLPSACMSLHCVSIGVSLFFDFVLDKPGGSANLTCQSPPEFDAAKLSGFTKILSSEQGAPNLHVVLACSQPVILQRQSLATVQGIWRKYAA